MYLEPTPVIANWFQTPDGPRFEVDAIDEDEDTIEIQYLDGEVDEMSFDEWTELEIIASAEPEDWSGPMMIWKRMTLVIPIPIFRL